MTFVLACVPAHNEQDSLTETLESLRNQTRPPDATIVITDRCDDYTWLIAKAMGAMPVETVGNTGYKAAAINQVLTPFVLILDPEDYVMVVDADTRLAPCWIERALSTGAGAVGGIFRGGHPTNFLGQLQCNEYARYARQVGRRGAKALVLTGTSTMVQVGIVRILLHQRGYIYSPNSRTEDNEFTLAIKHLGHVPLSPKECVVYTETMPTLRMLWRQRFRWYRGALEDLWRYGWTPITAPYIGRTIMLYVSIVILALYLLVVLPQGVRFTPLWSAVGVIFVIERMVTVKREGWRGMALSFPMVFEMAYVVFLDTIFIASLIVRKRKW